MNVFHRIVRLVTALATWSMSTASTAAEYWMSQRGIACSVLFVALFLSVGGWLRPPLSPDIRGTKVSIGILPSQSAADLVEGHSRIAIDSPGVLLSIFILASLAIVLVWPQQFERVAGFLLALSIATNAGVAMNHPLLLELMDRESSERQAMVAFMTVTYPTVLSESDNGRVSLALTDPSLNDLVRGTGYLSFSRVLIALAAVSTLYATNGTIVRRLQAVGNGLIIGISLTALVCAPRIIGEFHIAAAEDSEMRGELDTSRQHLNRARTAFPELSNLVSTWLLAGSLDYQQGLVTPAAELWQAERWAMNDDLPRATALYLRLANSGEDVESVARIQAAKYLTQVGLQHNTAGRIASATETWRRARALDPLRRDCVLYLGVALSLMDLHDPERVEAELKPILNRMADGAMRADTMNVVGDAYFLAGNAAASRSYYMKSYEVFNLPKTINYWALKGLGGF